MNPVLRIVEIEVPMRFSLRCQAESRGQRQDKIVFQENSTVNYVKH